MDILVAFTIPAIGALIGYVTNWVAIKMLFRPHTERRIFGIRVPFTPGLIPARRAEMAQRIGAAIAKHLITEESVSKRFDSPAVHQRIEDSVEEYLDQFLAREFGSISSLIPQSFASDWVNIQAKLREHIRAELLRIVNDPKFEKTIEAQMNERLKILLSKPLADLLPEDLLAKLSQEMGDWLVKLVSDEAFSDQITAIIDDKFDAFLGTEKPIAEYIPTQLKEAVNRKIYDLLPSMLAKFGSLLENEEMKKRIKIALYDMADQMLSETFREDSLWQRIKFNLMETFVMSTDEMKLKIDKSVEEAGPRLVSILQTEDVRQKIYRALVDAIETFLNRPVSQYSLDPEAVANLKNRVSLAVVGLAKSETFRSQMTSFLTAKIEASKIKSLQELFPNLDAEKISLRLTAYLISLIRDQSSLSSLTKFTDEQISLLLKRPIGRLDRFISSETVTQAKEWLSNQAIQILKRETPKMMQSLDVQALVREKVDELPLAEVEQLVLAITSRQLKAITWFGAILGFLIGLFQVGITLIGSGLGS